MERSIGAIFVMSGWHRVHHSDEQRHTDSHYANLLTFWDRLFGTAHRNVAPGEISVGLKEFQADATQTVWNQLMLPFRRPQAE
jgi:sterol desaturase/sphingolipid hydroxylase (fatty acid hydroxylase superfamily)